jgi:short-subunit dehydrogenase involved in D-alanine esterification of teichoic acids
MASKTSAGEVLIIGATSGIGLALASRYIAAGSHVIVSGRRAERLTALQEEHGASKVSTSIFDITNLSGIPEYVIGLFRDHPDISTVVLNAGMQRAFDLSDPATVDLKLLDLETTTNYTAHVHLTIALLPHLFKAPAAQLVFISSGLSLVPSARVINYSASKAALHAFVLSLRRQLHDTSVKVVEVVPPAVSTELHDVQKAQGFELPKAVVMGLEEFTETAWKGLSDGEEVVYVGGLPRACGDGWEQERLKLFGMINKDWKSGYGRD